MTTNVNRHGQVNQQFGEWNTLSRYATGDMVIFNRSIYMANGNIPANSPFTTGTTGATWSMQLVNAKPAGSVVQVTGASTMGTLLVRTSIGKIYSCSTDSATSFQYPGSGRRLDVASPTPVGITNMSEVVFYDPISNVEELGNATFVGTQGLTAYVLFDTGNLWAWGRNDYGQLGIGNTNSYYSPRLIAVDVAEVYVNSSSLRAGHYVRTVIRKNDGKIYACGYNGLGALGLGPGAVANVVAIFTELPWCGTNPTSVWNLGSFAGCIVACVPDGATSRIMIAGANIYGQLGDGTTAQITTATNLTTNWTSNEAGPWEIRNIKGTFGEADADNTAQSNDTSFMMMWLSRSDTGKNLIMTCGYNSYGSMGNGSTANIVSTPFSVTIPGYTNPPVKQTNVLGGNSCYVLLTDGKLFSWGRNDRGQLGLGNTTNRSTPTTLVSTTSPIVAGLDNISDMLFTNVAAEFKPWLTQLVVRKNNNDPSFPGAYMGTGYNASYFIGNGTGDTILTLTKMRFPSTTDWIVTGNWNNGTTESQNAVLVDDEGSLWQCGVNVNGQFSYNSQLGFGIPGQVRVNPAIL